MTTNRTSSSDSTWEGMSPWEKAAEWSAAVPEIADKVMALATKHAEHQWRMDEQNARHQRKMDILLWCTQLLGLIGGLACVVIFAMVGWHTSSGGHPIVGIGTFLLGTGLTAGVYGVGRSMSKRQLTEPPRPLASEESMAKQKKSSRQ